jgi:hypothetical protein
MSDIHWPSVLEYAQWCAGQGKLMTALFTDERQTDLPGDYHGEPTVWPSEQEVFRHFCENPEAWELVARGYEWRSFKLHDRIEGWRKRVEKGSLPARDASVLMNSAFTELRFTKANALKDKPEGKGAPEPKSDDDVKDDIAERLARAEVRRLSAEPAKPKGRVTKGQAMLPDGFHGQKKSMQ